MPKESYRHRSGIRTSAVGNLDHNSTRDSCANGSLAYLHNGWFRAARNSQQGTHVSNETRKEANASSRTLSAGSRWRKRTQYPGVFNLIRNQCTIWSSFARMRLLTLCQKLRHLQTSWDQQCRSTRPRRCDSLPPSA
jgi:hypothetical protein